MSHLLINHNDDLKRLMDEGYDMELLEGHIIIHHVPYVNEKREVAHGSIISTLDPSGDNTVKPSTHVAHWAGSHPCDSNGALLVNLVGGPEQQQIRNGLVSSFCFSQKPPEGYPDYYKKMTTYIRLLQSEARVLEPNATALVGLSCTLNEIESVFNYSDTASSRMGTTSINERLKKDKIAIIGLGGTGSYVLDLVSKTPVEEIHLFDDDAFLSHNAFRAPGAPSKDDIVRRMAKVDRFAEIYSNMRQKIFPHQQRIDESNLSALDPITVVFLCVDAGESRQTIVNYLARRKTLLIDVGIGIRDDNGALSGLVRVTTCTPFLHQYAASKIHYGDAMPDEYSNNIQIADVNALGAALAVIKWKKMRNFYHNLNCDYNTIYGIATNTITNSVLPNETQND